MGSDEVLIRAVGRVGRITLARPKALNALSHGMVRSIGEALRRWRNEGGLDLIVIDAEGGRAFCAGGDIAALYESGVAGNFSDGRTFWAEEYEVNARIANCPIPYLAIMDGIVMGGGVGVSAHGSHRVVTERSMIAMPECGIGLIPDVGGTWLLSRAPGHLGEFLGLSGWRMTGADAVLAGFADVFVPSHRLDGLKARLEETGSVSALEEFGAEPGVPPLEAHLDFVERHFSGPTALDCLRSLESDGSEMARKVAGMIRKGCPLSVACTFEMVRKARHLAKLEEALAREYRFTYRSMSEGQFLEGIRALIIDKDQKPDWRPARLEDVSPEMIGRMLAPLGDSELSL
ncbi:MAG: enoyl-CoA hydratase/isomerase family protein [Hyphomicrobiales bacterium]